MKRLRVLVSVIIAVSLCLGMTVTAFAEERTVLSEGEEASLSEVLNGVEFQKDMLGLSHVDFYDLQLGEPVQTYEYIRDGFEPGRVLYPILYHGELILWAIEQDGMFQVTTAFVSRIADRIDTEEPYTVVYDRNSAYLYAGGKFTLLGTSEMEEEARSVLDPEAMPEAEFLETSVLSGREQLDYTADTAREQRYYACDVGNVAQPVGSAICWAATVACIVNYCKGTALTAEGVAKEYFGTLDNPNQGLNTYYIPGVLSRYEVYYSYKEQAPSDDDIMHNIINDYPIYGGWTGALPSGENKGHGTCIYGIDILGSYIYIMDPEIGFTSASFNGSAYSYAGALSTTLTLDRAICEEW